MRLHDIQWMVALAAGDVPAPSKISERAGRSSVFTQVACAIFMSWRGDAALATGDITSARPWADDGVAATRGVHLAEGPGHA